MFTQDEKEYLKFCWKGFIEFIRWEELIITVIFFTIFSLIFGWIGFIICLIFNYLTLEVRSPPFMLGDYPEEEIPERKCSAGIKDCEICHNEYDHEFNKEYDKKYKKWYNF